MKKILLFFLSVISCLSHAEIHKCMLPSEKVLYQSEPCPSTSISQNIVQIKDIDPRILEEAQVKFKAFEAQLAIQKQADALAARQRREEWREQQIVNSLRRAAWAQEQEALLARQQSNYRGWGGYRVYRILGSTYSQPSSHYPYPYPSYHAPVQLNGTRAGRH